MANNLAKIRGKHQMSQSELASAIGVTKQGICFAEKKKCSLGLAKKVAAYLGEDIIDVLGTDVFVISPKTDAEKEKFIALIKEI